MTTLCVIQARLGSTRFPRKALADLRGMTVLEHVVGRVFDIRGVDDVVVACPKVDQAALRFVAPRVYGFDGDSSDVLRRYVQAVLTYEQLTGCDVTAVARVTGDCPLLKPRICEDVLALFHATKGCEYASNVSEGYVDGEDFEVFTRSALMWAAREAKHPYDREHVTTWFRRNVKCATLPAAENRSHLKTSVDTPEDLEFVRGLLGVA